MGNISLTQDEIEAIFWALRNDWTIAKAVESRGLKVDKNRLWAKLDTKKLEVRTILQETISIIKTSLSLEAESAQNRLCRRNNLRSIPYP